MEIFVLLILAVLIAHYALKRSKIIYAAHAILFVCYFIFSLFTLDIPEVEFVMNRTFGEEVFAEISSLIKMPFGWAYSAGAVICTLELILCLVVTFTAAGIAAKKIRGIIKNKFFKQVNTKEGEEQIPAKDPFTARKIFLTYCRLLN